MIIDKSFIQMYCLIVKTVLRTSFIYENKSDGLGELNLNKSASRVMDILTLISTTKVPLGVSEISRELNIPKSSTFDVLDTMVKKGFLELNSETKTYRLGLKSFEVGSTYLLNTDLHRVAAPFLEKLMEQTGETAFLAVESDGEIVYLDKMETPSTLRTTATLGTRSPMYSTGLGKAILAAYPDSKVFELMKNKTFIKRTSKSITNINELIADLNRIRKRGYSIDNRENEDEVFCIACPILNENNLPIAAISVSGLAMKMTNEMIKRNSRFIIDAALKISKRLGYRKKSLNFNP
ncbi:IclR family transcriptional regulator [Sporolactobacillus sp. THM7-4]|nr:IclR family transcriptional regulator [Sporolactobacillus sp. THM7-4]